MQIDLFTITGEAFHKIPLVDCNLRIDSLGRKNTLDLKRPVGDHGTHYQNMNSLTMHPIERVYSVSD